MRKLKFFLLLLLVFLSCDKEDAPDCWQKAGEIVTSEVVVAPFEELIVHKGIKLFIKQGAQQKVQIETGRNLLPEITAEVIEGRLVLRNGNGCNLFRDYNITEITVTTPNLSWLQNAGNNEIRSLGKLHFPQIWLRGYDQDDNPDISTIGDFHLQLVSEKIRLTGDNYSNFFLSGSTELLDAYIADGDGRLEAADLIAQTVEIQHRGTNKLIVNPQQVLKGEIRSTGDVISVNRPPVVKIETFYTGRLVFE